MLVVFEYSVKVVVIVIVVVLRSNVVVETVNV